MIPRHKIIRIPALIRLVIVNSGIHLFRTNNWASDAEITLKSKIRGLKEARINSRKQNLLRWVWNPCFYMKLHDLTLCQGILQEFSRFLQIEFTFYFTGLMQASFNCSNYTFHENSAEGRSWETSRLLCQNSSEGDLVSIEEEEERNFVRNIIKNLTATKYFIGLKRDNGKWKWLSNQTTVDSSQGKSPWAPGQPSGRSRPDRKMNCATIYGKYRNYLGRFDDLPCSRRLRYSGHICERAVLCTKHERGRSLCVEEYVLKDQEHAFSVFSLSYGVSRKRKTTPSCSSTQSKTTSDEILQSYLYWNHGKEKGG